MTDPLTMPAGAMVPVPVAGLLRIEWAYDEWHDDLWCPACGAGKARDNGHETTCWLAAALAACRPGEA